MPLVIGLAFFIGIVVLVLLGSHLLGPDSWPLQSDREEARRDQANAEHAELLRQRVRGAVPKDRAGDSMTRKIVCNCAPPANRAIVLPSEPKTMITASASGARLNWGGGRQ
jgi:hypothetical protein